MMMFLGKQKNKEKAFVFMKDKQDRLLWAPWRIKYVTQKKNRGCIFCKIYREKKDRVNHVVLRSQHSFVLLNAFPYNNGHVMVISNRHVASFESLNASEIFDMNANLVKMMTIYKKILNPQGYNIGMNLGKIAGAGVEKHLHMHLVPRWLGDTNFMPVVADTKVVAQSLEELYYQITAYLGDKSYSANSCRKLSS